MKFLIEKRRYFTPIFVTILMVLGTYLPGYADITPVSDRTPQVRDAIVKAVPNINEAANVTEAHLTAITSLNLRNSGITVLKIGDFSGMTGLTSLNLFNNQLSSLPDDIFVGLTSLTTIRLGRNAVDPLPLTVSLEKVSDGQFKAIAPAGATFDIVLPVTVKHGSISDGATTLTIPHGSVESGTLTVTRTPGTTAVVTADIGTLPSLPRNHFGYALVKSGSLPLDIITGINTAPVLDVPSVDDSPTDNIIDIPEVTTPDPSVTNTAPAFLEGENTARILLENTAAGVNIGDPVLATDVNNDALRYTLAGIDADAFDMDSSGQLITKSPLDYETKYVYTVTVTVTDEELSDTITVIIIVMDINDTVSGMGFVPVADRTPEVRDAIVAAVPNVIDATDVTEAQVANITSLNLRNRGISKLKTGDFSGMTSLSNLNLFGNNLRRLPPGIFDGLTALTSLRLGGNVLDPMPLIVFLQNVGMGQFKVVITTGAPFTIVLPINVTNGSMSSGATSVTIPQGSMTSETFTVLGTSAKVAFGTLPRIPAKHFGYKLAKSTVCSRTQQVADAITKAVGVSNCSTVTERDLATITHLDLSDASITSLKAGDFDGMFSLMTLYLHDNDLNNLPDGVFDDLVSLDELFLNNNKLKTLRSNAFDGLSSLHAINLQDNNLTSLPDGIFDEISNVQRISLSKNRLTSLPDGIFTGLTQLNQLDLSGNPNPNSQVSLIVALQKVGTNQVKAVVPTAAPFTLTLSITITNGRIVGGTTPFTIPKGDVESQQFTVTRTMGTFDAVTADISTPLPSLPSTHTGYVFFKSHTLPLKVLPSINLPPVFKDGTNTTRTIAENTAAGTNIGDAVSAIDRNVNDTLTYTLSGPDVASFDLDSATGQLKTKVALDYETKNAYSLTLTVSDGLATDTTAVTINVTDVYENRAPVLTEGDTATRMVAENTTASTNIGNAVTATDADGDTLTYTLEGTDAASFDVDSTTGQIKTKATLDYETKNTYAVTLTVSDGLATETITVTINVTDIDENRAPVFTEGDTATRTVAENTAPSANIGEAMTATDPDNDTLTYHLEGQDASAFGIDNNTGQLKTDAALDYETKTTYTVSVTASDGKRTATITVTIYVTDINELPDRGAGGQGDSTDETIVDSNGDAPIQNRAPVFTEGSTTTRSVTENVATGTDIGSPVDATDADGDTLTYDLGGTDENAFSIDSTTAQLRTNTFLDYETQSSYTVTITVSDGSLLATITVTIIVTSVDETIVDSNGDAPIQNRAPVFTEGSTTTRSVTENVATGTDIGSPVDATDADGDTLTYDLRGTDENAFSIDSTTGQLRTNAALDYETKSSYTVTVTVSDGYTGNVSITVTINVSDVLERNYPLYGRTPQVQYYIVEAVPGVNSAEDVTAAHLATITYLSLGGTRIRSLRTGDFKGLTSLTQLNLAHNSISDISPLADLTNLTSLELWNNDLSDISPLADLTNLTSLGLRSNSVSDISPLADLTNLTSLDLWANDISDISALGNLTQLTVLYLRANDISDISALADLTNLTRLDLSENDISDISALADLTNLTSLELSLKNNAISDLSPLGNLTQLTNLALIQVGITDISALGNLTNLRVLWLHFNSISDISALGNLTNLTRLYLNDNSISDVSPLENLTSLTRLTLFRNPVSDYAPLRRLIVATGVLEGHPGLTIGTLDTRIRPVADNNAPEFTDGASTTRSIAENTAADTNIGTAIAATDADTADTLTYYLGGTDVSSFSIVKSSGQLKTSVALDYETKSSYSVKVAVSDGKGGTDTIDVTINITDVAGAAPSVETPPVTPDNTDLLTNFPNPFNPETWIPFHLAKDADVTLHIYAMNGQLVRTLTLGYQAAGVYQNRSRAAYWDGKNEFGEKVASGVYFYTLKAGDFSATRKMLIMK